MNAGGESNEVTTIECTFLENVAGRYGGGACSQYFARPSFETCIFGRNSSGVGGGGVACHRDSAVVDLRNCTLSGNSGGTGGGGLCCYNTGNALVTGTIIAFSLEGPGVECDATSSAGLGCCDVYGNAGGDWVGCIAGQYGVSGNISADPLFCGPYSDDYSLAEFSPCAPGASPPCGLIGADSVRCVVTDVAEESAEVPSRLRLFGNAPNPFNPTTEIEFSIPSGTEPSRVTLTVYNSLGQRVRTLVDTEKAGGIYRVVWDGTDENRHQVASGVYFYRLVWNGESMTRRMVLLK